MTIETIFGAPENLVHLNYIQLLLLMCGYMFLLTKASSLSELPLESSRTCMLELSPIASL